MAGQRGTLGADNRSIEPRFGPRWLNIHAQSIARTVTAGPLHINRGDIEVSSRRQAREAPARRQRVQSVATGIALLKVLGRLGGVASLTAIAAEVGEMPAKVHRYLASLIEQGLVIQNTDTQHYQLGPEVIHLGLAAMRLVDPIRAAEPAMLRLCEDLGVTCTLAVLGNLGPTIVRWQEPRRPLTVNVRAGSVMPVLWSASGRVFLACAGDARLLDMARHELSEASADLRASLDRRRPIERLCESVLSNGYALAVDTLIKGLSAVAVPIVDFSGRVCAALAVLGTASSIDTSANSALIKAVCKEGLAISRSLGRVDD